MKMAKTFRVVLPFILCALAYVCLVSFFLFTFDCLLLHCKDRHLAISDHAEDDDRQSELEEYYSRGSHFGVPASVTLFQLAHTMQLGSPYVLW